MSFFGKKPKTAQQKAQMAKTSMTIRAIALGYLVFFVIIPLINPEPEDVDSLHPTVRWLIIAAFIIACTALAVTSTLEYLRKKKEGRYSPAFYTDDEGVESYIEPEKNDDNEQDNDDEDEDDEDDDDDEDNDDEDDDDEEDEDDEDDDDD